MYYFFKSVSLFSNLTPSKYIISEKTYENVEQGFAYEKAVTFGDTEKAQAIIINKEGIKCHQLSREVKGYDENTWRKLRLTTMYRHVKQKFLQNRDFKDNLLKTKNLCLVYLSRANPFWSTGTTSTNPALWGDNWLGKVLMSVRNDFFQHFNKLVLRKLDRLAYRYHTTEKPLQRFNPKEDDWDQFVGERICRLLTRIDCPKDGTVLELGPGSVSKVGYGLQKYGFTGTIILIEPEETSLKTILTSYQKLLPCAKIVGYQKTLDQWLTSTDIQVIDCIIGNHIIDDILIGKFITRKLDSTKERDNFFEDHYDSADLKVTSRFWERFANDVKLHRIIMMETLDELKCLVNKGLPNKGLPNKGLPNKGLPNKGEPTCPNRITGHQPKQIWSCYDSFAFRDNLGLNPPLHHAHIFSQKTSKEALDFSPGRNCAKEINW